jgi:tetratricopeptide (TPR) repeat protein
MVEGSPPRRVFLSRTSEMASFPTDLSLVDAAQRALIRADCVPVDMQYFGPDDREPAKICEERVAGADVYVAIVGFRYGTPVRDRPEMSYTELEYEAAGKHGIPRLIFLVSEDFAMPPRVTRDPQYGDRQEAFRERLLRGELTAGTIATRDELETKLFQALRDLEPRPRPAPCAGATVFISYIGADGLWADWVARVLEVVGYRVTSQDWRFVAGQDLARRVSEVDESHDCILVLVSTVFAASPYTNDDWTAQLARAVQDRRRVLPVHVEEVEPSASLAGHDTVEIDGRTPMSAALQILGELRRRGFTAARRLRIEDDPVVALDYPGAEPEISNILRRNVTFTNRLDTLRQVCGALHVSFDGRRSATCSLNGIAGVGKTEVAIEFAHRWRSRFSVIWWISAESSVSTAESLAALARALEIDETADQKEIIRKVWVELGRRRRWLLIYDNVEPGRHLDQLWPSSGSGSVIVTSRSPAWGGLVDTTLAVDVFTPEHAQTFLRKRSKADDGPAVKMVSEKLGYLPLALDQAGAYIEETQISVEEYDSLYSAGTTRLLELGYPDRYDRTVATTLSMQIQEACDDHACSKDLLGVIAFLAPDDIPRWLLTGHPHVLHDELRSAVSDPPEFHRLMTSLIGLALVRADPERIRVHRLLREILREQFTSKERTLYQSSAIRLVSAAFPRNSDEVSTWPTCGWLLPHVLACTGEVDPLLPALCGDSGGVLQAAGRYLHLRGEYLDARTFYLRALAVREHPEAGAPADRAETLISLGRVHYHLADLPAAQRTTEAALGIFWALHGLRSLEVLGTMFHLSRVLRERDDLLKSEQVVRDALRALKDIDGMRLPIAATGLHVLGDVLWRRHDLGSALAAFRQALEIRQDLSDAVPTVDLAASHKHVGIILLEMGRLADAERELRRAYDLFLAEYGHDHPDVVDVDGHLAEVIRRMGRLEEALERAERALRLRRDRLQDHPDVAGSLLRYGAVLRDLGRHDEAVEALRESVKMFALRMGEGHYYVAEARIFLAQSLLDVDVPEGARRELEDALVILETVRGPDHAATVRARQLLQELPTRPVDGRPPARPSLVPLLEKQIEQVRRRVDSGLGGYAYELDEIRKAVEQVDGLRHRLELDGMVRDMNPGTGKPQVLLEFRDVHGEPVVLKVYGRQRPNEAAVQGLWAAAGVPTAPILASGDDPVSWLLMGRLSGRPPSRSDGIELTSAVAQAMVPAHQTYRADVGEPKDLYQGIGVHLRGVLAATESHDYRVPPGIDAMARDVMGSGRQTFLHGDLATVNLLVDGAEVRFLDTCGYTGPPEFDAARWCARVGGSARAEEALDRWLEVETALDRGLARRLLALELFMEAGVREIIKDEQGRPWDDRDPETIALLAAGGRLLDAP